MKNLTTIAKENYYKIIEYYTKTGYLDDYKLNFFWGGDCFKTMIAIIETATTPQEAVHRIQQTWLFSVNTAEQVKDRAVEWILDEQRSRNIDLFSMPPHVQESSFSYPANNTEIQGRLVTPDFLRTLTISQEILSHVQKTGKQLNILELGAGCGHLARTIHLFENNTKYWITDIPETLYFSFQFLSMNFPEKKFLFVTSPDEMPTENTDADFIFIPTKFAEMLKGRSFDLFVNTASMGEMTNDNIRYWMNFIQKEVNIGYVYTLNRFLNTVLTDGRHDWRLNENECSVHYDRNWDIIEWDLEPTFARCPYIDTIIARYVRILVKRNLHQTEESFAQRASELTMKLKDQDWLRLEKVIPPDMNARDNILCTDGTKKGTLCMLWNLLRFSPEMESYYLMLKYLETIVHRGSKEFEETYFYEAKFCELYEAAPSAEFETAYQIIQQKNEVRVLPVLYPSLFEDFVSNQDGPKMIEQDYFEHNISTFKGQYYAIKQIAGEFPQNKNRLNDLIKKNFIFTGFTISEVKLKILTQKMGNQFEKSDRASKLRTRVILKSKKLIHKFITSPSA